MKRFGHHRFGAKKNKGVDGAAELLICSKLTGLSTSQQGHCMHAVIAAFARKVLVKMKVFDAIGWCFFMSLAKVTGVLYSAMLSSVACGSDAAHSAKLGAVGLGLWKCIP